MRKRINEVWSPEGECEPCDEGDHGKEIAHVRFCTCCGQVVEEVNVG